ncbi:MAG: hypothetical protein COB51_07225 [Moraxellaceae bacterium]|nr:MAG: hypothetical protein COB51_07225 [Moraxellaceae bacterium]
MDNIQIDKLETTKPWGMELNTFCMLMHLSQLSSVVVPGLGVILPIAMWATNKEDHVEIDHHGKNILNWIISVVIYSLISGALLLISVGVLGFVAIAVCNFIFAIIAAVKANNGEVWSYPLSIKFFKIEALALTKSEVE